MPAKGESWVELRKNPKYFHTYKEFNQLSVPIQNILKKMVSENPAHRPTIKQVISEIDASKSSEKLWTDIAEKAIKGSKALSPKFKGEKIWVAKSKSYNT